MSSPKPLWPDWLPPCPEAPFREAQRRAQGIQGALNEREARLLFALAYSGPGQGSIVEIGSFQGLSTVYLAWAARQAGREKVVAIDPHTAPAPSDPQAPSGGTEGLFRANLQRAGVADWVEVRVALSEEAAREWQEPVRLLWIDGDHTYAGVRRDFDLWSPFLVEGGVLVMHDVLHAFDGPVRVFVERVLESEEFGPTAVVGSCGVALKRAPTEEERRWKGFLARRLRPLIPYGLPNGQLRGLRKVAYKILRAQVPH